MRAKGKLDPGCCLQIAHCLQPGSLFGRKRKKMTAYVIAEVVVKDKERYAAEFVPIISKAH